jgi:hypothetical protein
VPNKFIWTVGLRLAWKSNVAAEWMTISTLSINACRSLDEIPNSFSPTSPAIAVSFPNTAAVADSIRVSKTYDKKTINLKR